MNQLDQNQSTMNYLILILCAVIAVCLYLANHKKERLKARLIFLLHGDKGAAKRLVLRQKQLNPKRSYNWCLEKAIFDLERDRGRF
ncbi:MAG: hypothetical protein EAZ77_06135 [Nostocales cyanobacterium]|nr:MAG: hypothetical protein EAZ77_06135 [Nostocales cyanobacterium]